MENQEKIRTERKKLEVRAALPGDRLATIEEFASGSGSTVSGETVIATVVGETHPDMVNRVINVDIRKQSVAPIPVTGDYVIGTVQSAQPSMAQVMIEAVNDIPSSKEFTGMLSMRDERRRRTSSPIKSGDVLRAKVSSTKNAIFHLTVDAPNCGVLYTVCSMCGKDVVVIGRDRIKCRECGWGDERLLSEDFVMYSQSQANS
ncbi:MAG: exosome complex RNA-binding protein Csl4 [Nitrososphaerales archaeon]